MEKQACFLSFFKQNIFFVPRRAGYLKYNYYTNFF